MIKTAFYCLLINCIVVNCFAVNYGYHAKVGVPRAIELMRFEGLQRIIGGSQVSSASIIPHQAGIVATLTNGWQSICGGSLISNSRVLTAAHCWWDGVNQAKTFTIVLGSITIMSGGTRINTNDVIVNPNWKPNAAVVTGDLAMVKITSVTFNNNIQAIPLPTVAQVNNNFAGMQGTVSGYGKIKDVSSGQPSSNLHRTTVTVMTNADCQKALNINLDGSHLCTSGTGIVGTCDGDSGGPLTVLINQKTTLVGVVSFGLDEGCEFGKPSVYSRVTAFLNWIQANM